jgi:hypothetical protein
MIVVVIIVIFVVIILVVVIIMMSMSYPDSSTRVCHLMMKPPFLSLREPSPAIVFVSTFSLSGAEAVKSARILWMEETVVHLSFFNFCAFNVIVIVAMFIFSFVC